NQSIAAHLAEDHAIAVVDVFPQRPADSRDIAQELADATGISTVIVQTPVNVSAVSTKYSRAELEAAQTNLPNGIGQVELVDTFYHNMESANPFNVMIGAVVLLTLCIFGMSVTTFFQVMRNLARA
ncbi:MAG: DUF6676 family protein, partial [Corynebacterium sp.]|nr:DUF6676 family protein [Corynebacterium sp.]